MIIQQDESTATFQIKRYEQGEIWVNDQCYRHSIIIWPHKLLSPWRPSHVDALRIEDFEPIFENKPDIVLLGTGLQLEIPPENIMNELYERGFGVEFMDSRAACHTYTVLAAELRHVAACILL